MKSKIHLILHRLWFFCTKITRI